MPVALRECNPEYNPRTARAEYVARVNRVIDHIEAHLHESLSLKDMAKVAHFSPYHFHRVFGAMVGETLHQFIQRLRVEKAARLLRTHPDMRIMEVALASGYSSSATLARAFKDTFGMSATQWRAERGFSCPDTKSKICKHLRNPRNMLELSERYTSSGTNHLTWRYTMSLNESVRSTIEVKMQPEYYVAYVRHVGPYGQTAVVPRLFDKLHSWAQPKGLRVKDALDLCVAHDDPHITEKTKLRLSVCMTVPKETQPEGEVGTMRIPGGLCGVAHFEIAPETIASAWNAVMGDWLPQSGYQPDDRPAYEIVRQSPRAHPEGKITLDICIPIRAL